ncbi:oxidoreductase family protein [Haloferula sp.]|uniref:oxidoreductase family protein n=1 Tax=Haloferula sp. TaxID=2497595 RepID=UPI00329C245E
MKDHLDARLSSAILTATDSSHLEVVEVIQDLWSGYGQILRIELDGASTVIAKHVCAPSAGNHPRGWNTDLSHQRKVRSYEVETAWYRHWSHRCEDNSRIPRFLSFERMGSDVLLLLEDLDAVGFPARLRSVNSKQLEACLSWLANFHATFINSEPTELWETGTYWHLQTRSDELKVLDDLPLKQAAAEVDERLKNARYQTIVHGDAKLANFCFSKEGDQVAAVDFQYVGGGCGMKDLAYFIGSCLNENECERRESELLETYFSFFREALAEKHPHIDSTDLEAEWRSLYPLAWTDFHRFLKGWSPGHWKINSYSERIARKVVAKLQNE